LQKIYRQPGNPVNLVIMARSMERREAAINQTRVVMRTIRRLNYEDEDDFTILTPEQILRVVNQFTAAFRAIIIAMPLLSIVVGGIVIMNIMMISVTERTREIGIRKSIGARRFNILSQFLVESLILSLVGGIMGVVFGIKLGQIVLSDLLSINQSPTTLAILTGFGISTVVGLFFGIYPAMKASRLNPIKALSYE
jgi:putative ABC transport system permease protein